MIITRITTLETVKKIVKIVFPFAFGLGVLWWMYREEDWGQFWLSLRTELHWSWMLFSLIFGITAMTARAHRWGLSLAPLGEKPRRRTLRNAIFLSYASSLIVPRVGEVMRCGTLKQMDGTSFSKSLGTVVTERLVDAFLMVLLTGLAFITQVPRLLDFLGKDLNAFLGRFTTTGYIVTALSALLVALMGATFLWWFFVYKKGNRLFSNLLEGITSIRHMQQKWLYLALSLGIWVSYFLHFYIAFFAFDFTADFSPMEAFFIFCVGTYAVLVPTPNGAGPWHFAVKTMLLIYGAGTITDSEAIRFALAVHTIQTLLVVVLGIYAWIDLGLMKRQAVVGE
ncbi:MAG: lysylphosphatidylglycerol synthase transmembrane domain-containing protein [Alloprevotella sp.]|nr:lysylphosphatidylglycerol synthase transmembrane domain-containing protein [Alloprevotella sp.]